MERRHHRRDGGMCFDESCKPIPAARVTVYFRPVMKTVHRGILVSKPELVSERPFSVSFFRVASVQVEEYILKVTVNTESGLRTHNYPMDTVSEWLTDVIDLCDKERWY